MVRYYLLDKSWGKNPKKRDPISQTLILPLKFGVNDFRGRCRLGGSRLTEQRNWLNVIKLRTKSLNMVKLSYFETIKRKAQ